MQGGLFHVWRQAIAWLRYKAPVLLNEVAQGLTTHLVCWPRFISVVGGPRRCLRGVLADGQSPQHPVHLAGLLEAVGDGAVP